MRSEKILIVLTLIFTCASAWTKEITDTLESSYGDRVIVTYDIAQNNGQFTIKFLDVRKTIGREFRNKYKKLDEIVVLFFDRKGNYEDNTEFSGINVDAFMIPQEVKYNLSKDGYFLLNDNPTLSMELTSGENAELSIPLFIAHYEGKRRYKVLSRCEDLKIKLSKKAFAKTTDESITQTVSQIVTTQEEVEGNIDEQEKEDVARNLINIIEKGLGASEISSSVQKHAERLGELWPEIKDPHVKEQCEDILRRYDLAVNMKKDNECEKENLEQEKKYEEEFQTLISYAQSILMKDDLSDYDISDLRTTVHKMRESPAIKNEALKAQMTQMSDACDERIKEIEKKKEQHNFLMIIGGVLLGILVFVGNQTLQHLRNVKNQKSIMDMQQNAIKRAEDEAKQRARNMVRSQINQIQGEAKRKTRNAIDARVGKIRMKKKGNKGFTI